MTPSRQAPRRSAARDELVQQVGAGHREPRHGAPGEGELLGRGEDRDDPGVRDAEGPEARIGTPLAEHDRGEESLVQSARVGDTQRDVARGVSKTRCVCKHVCSIGGGT